MLHGIVGTFYTAYQTLLHNYFADGSESSPFTYHPISNIVRLFLGCAVPIVLGAFLLSSAILLRKNQLRLAIFFAVSGPIACLFIQAASRIIKALFD